MATKRCTSTERVGRLNKVDQFFEAANMLDLMADQDDHLDALVTMCVHAGIAASDVICCVQLGRYSRGQDHQEAVALLAEVDRSLSKDLAKLLKMKNKPGYGSELPSAATAKLAMRSSTRLVQAARLS